VRCPGDPGWDRPQDEVIPVGPVNLLGTRVTAQVRLNRSEVGRRNAAGVGPVTDPALLECLHGLPLRRPVCDPALWAETSGLPDGVVDRGDVGCTVVRLLERPLVIDDVILPGERGRELRAVQDVSLFAGFTRRWVQARRVAIPDTVILEAKLSGVGLLGPRGQVVLPAEPPTITTIDRWAWLLAEKAYGRWLKQTGRGS
jgi:hypothetical protein